MIIITSTSLKSGLASCFVAGCLFERLFFPNTQQQPATKIAKRKSLCIVKATRSTGTNYSITAWPPKSSLLALLSRLMFRPRKIGQVVLCLSYFNPFFDNGFAKSVAAFMDFSPFTTDRKSPPSLPTFEWKNYCSDQQIHPCFGYWLISKQCHILDRLWLRKEHHL